MDSLVHSFDLKFNMLLTSWSLMGLAVPIA